jgi:hypothetical protein
MNVLFDVTMIVSISCMLDLLSSARSSPTTTSRRHSTNKKDLKLFMYKDCGNQLAFFQKFSCAFLRKRSKNFAQKQSFAQIHVTATIRLFSCFFCYLPRILDIMEHFCAVSKRNKCFTF